MTKKGAIGRNIYVRITEDGKRKYVNVGVLYRSGNVYIMEKVVNPDWWE